MTSTTINSDATPDGANDPQKARPRRRRPARSHDAATAATPTVESASAPAPAATETPAAETAAPASSADEAQHTHGSGRSRRGRGRGEGRKSAVQLIVPPTQTAESAATGDDAGESATSAEHAAQEASAIAPAAATEARVIPVTTGATPATTAASAHAEPAPTRSRYRFASRTPVVTTTPLVRPEKLSSGATTASAPAEEPSPASFTATAPATADEGDADGWQATVAEVAPADVARSAAEAQSQAASAPQANDERTVDDLMSALGLRERPAAPRTEAVPEAREEDESEAPAETEHGAAEEASEEASEAEGQNGTRRRRRRRRSSSHTTAAEEMDDDQALADTLAATPPLRDEEIEPERNTRNGYEPYAPYGPLDQPYSPYTRAPRERTSQPSAWDVSASQQQQQYGQVSPYSPSQGSPSQGAYGSPEPSFARGFGPQPRGVAGPPREPVVRPARTERGTESPISSSQLAQIVSSAISQQTDRLLTELRHQQQPPSMLLQLPAMPSTERIGVFVDVANLFYSARSMRMSLDFGRMLDFLRSNRRLVRAHAYAPTNPDANADQSFLNAVKGMGYRITTKNYKTFSSGAKKADMDLDLCMDIVRIVDAGAVDTIVLVSGDSDFLPLLEYCADHGVRVEVAAFDDAAAMILRQSCDLFINLSMVDEIRA